MKHFSLLVLVMSVVLQPTAGALPVQSLATAGQRLSVLPNDTDFLTVARDLGEIDPEQARMMLAAMPSSQRLSLLKNVHRLATAAAERVVTLGEILVISQAGVQTAGLGLAISVGLLALASYVLGLEIGCRRKASNQCPNGEASCVSDRLTQCHEKIGLISPRPSTRLPPSPLPDWVQ